MKAKIKATGEILEILDIGVSGKYFYLSNDKKYSRNELEFLSETIDRQQTRIQFVGQIASAIMGNYQFYAEGIAEECERSGKSRPEMVAQMSLEIADALIEGLEKGGQGE